MLFFQAFHVRLSGKKWILHSWNLYQVSFTNKWPPVASIKPFGIRIQNIVYNILETEKALKSSECRNVSLIKRLSQFLGNIALLNPFHALYSILSSDPARRDWLEQPQAS